MWHVLTRWPSLASVMQQMCCMKEKINQEAVHVWCLHCHLSSLQVCWPTFVELHNLSNVEITGAVSSDKGKTNIVEHVSISAWSAKLIPIWLHIGQHQTLALNSRLASTYSVRLQHFSFFTAIKLWATDSAETVVRFINFHRARALGYSCRTESQMEGKGLIWRSHRERERRRQDVNTAWEATLWKRSTDRPLCQRESSTEQLSAELLSEHSIVRRRKPAPGGLVTSYEPVLCSQTAPMQVLPSSCAL